MQFGKYNLIEKIGEGGLSEIFFAQNTAPVTYSRELVIKRIHRRLTQDLEFGSQFLLAAEQSSFLNHHNIAQTFESGVIDGYHYVAQEHIDGLTLEDVLARHEQRLQAIPIEITLEIILQVCEALTYAYWARDDRGRQLHMVHRNLKPSNIMVNRHGVVKVVDFGLINAGQNMGSGQGSLVLRMAAYMSPEQAKGEEVDNRSDIFSLGTIFYEMLTLKPLFCMDNPLQTLRMVQEGRCEEQLRELAQHPVGQGLLPLLKSMLGASPWDRPTEAKQLIPHLRAVLGRLSQQIYLPNWIQEEMAAVPRASNRARPALADVPADPPPVAGPAAVAPPPAQPVPVQPPPPSPPPYAVLMEQGVSALGGALKGINRKYLAFGGGLLGALFIGLVALFSVSGKSQEAATPMMARLRISSTPPGAQVYIPGVQMPRATPFEFDVPLSAGYVDLRAQLEGYEPATARILLQPNVLNQYNFAMNSAEEELGTLEVHVYPPNGRLYLDGGLVEGEETYQLEIKANKPHTLRLTADGYAPREEEVRIEPQGYRRMSLALDLLPSTGYVNNAP